LGKYATARGYFIMRHIYTSINKLTHYPDNRTFFCSNPLT
jgi:hypothetical protein